MATTERVTISLPADLIRDIDRVEKSRSRFLEDAAKRELERRRRNLLRQSLDAPHPESAELAEAGFDQWAAALPEEDASELVNPDAGAAVRWVPGQGWEQTQ